MADTRRDQHTDLIEVVEAVGSGPPDVRLQPALDALVAWRLPDGSWPLRRSFWPDAVTVRERKSLTKGNPMVTIRAVRALQACHESTRS